MADDVYANPKAKWARNQVEVDSTPGAPTKRERAEAEAKAKAAPLPIPQQLAMGDKMKEGFQRVVDFVREKRQAGVTNKEELALAVKKFVEEYPSRVSKVQKEYWDGMKAGMAFYRGEQAF